MNQKEIQKIADKTWKRKYKIGGANPFYSMGFADAEEVAKIISSKRVVLSSSFPRCSFVSGWGKRCRKHSAITNRLHLEGEMYDYPAWVEVNLCPEHHLHFGGDFKPKKKGKSIA